MKRSLLSVLLILLCLANAAAQEPAASPLDGQWSGWLKSATGQMEVKLKLKGKGGEWQFYPQPAQARQNPCWTQVHPVSLGEADAEPRTLVLEGSKLGKDCEDVVITMRMQGEAMSLSLPSGTQGVLKRR